MFNHINQPTKLDHFKYRRAKRLSKINKPESLFSRSIIANIIIVAFCIADFVTIYSVWNLLLIESPLMLYLIVISFVICLDITMSICGNVLKQYRQGLRSKKDTIFIVSVCVAAFLAAYIFYLLLRISMKDMAFGETGSFGESASGNLTTWFATLALAATPLATSLASMGVSYAVSNPLEDKILDHKKARIELETHINSIKTIIAESENVDDYVQSLYEREDKLFKSFLEDIDGTVLRLQMKVRTIIMEKIGRSNADAITEMTNSCHQKKSDSNPSNINDNEYALNHYGEESRSNNENSSSDIMCDEESEKEKVA